jgi:hypothetical protein
LSLHKAMASRMLESVKTILLDFGFKDSSDSAFSDASLPPAKGRSQIIAICDWAIWCRRISLALVGRVLQSTGFGEKVSNVSQAHDITISSGRQRSAIKNLQVVCASANSEIESCSFNIIQPTAMMHHIMLQLQRMMLCAWVRDLIGDILNSSNLAVIDSNCWAWSSIIRYHVDNCESDFLSVSICDEATCFGYEVIAQAAGHSSFPIVCMTDRMRLICSLAVSASACVPSTLDGPCASGKATTINFLASLYGRFVATLPCCASMQNLAIDRFLDLALHSSSVSTVCCIKDMDSLAPNLLSQLAESLRRINGIISDRVCTRMGGSSHRFWFLCCTTSGLNMGKNVSHIASSFSRTIRIIDVDRVTLIACVLRGFGFSLAQVISQTLHVFYQQLSTSIQSPPLAAHVSSAAVIFNVLHLIITTWNISRSERDLNQRSNPHQTGDCGASAREVQCVVQSLCKVFQPLLSALGDSLNFRRIVSACFGIDISEPFSVTPSSNSFPSNFDQIKVFFHTLGIDCDHHLETAINLWNCTMNSVASSPFVILVGADGSGRNFALALFEMLSIHFSQMTFKKISICSSHELIEKLLQRILEQVDRSLAISHFDFATAESNDFEIDLFRSSKPLSSETSTWLILYLQSCVLAQSFGNGRIPNLFDRIRSSAKCVAIESGVTIIERHAYNKYIYIIVTGNVSLTYEGKLWSAGSGHMIGDFTAINGVKSICAAVSASKCTLIMVPSHVFSGNMAEVNREALDYQVSTISKRSHCLIVADALKSAFFIDSLAYNSDYLSYTTWGADGCSWHRNLKLSTSIVIKCNDIQHNAPTSLSRCAIVASPLLNADSQVSIALNWLRRHSFATTVGSIVIDHIASLFHNHASCCMNFFMKLENRSVSFTTFAKTAAQLLVCVCASSVSQQGQHSSVGSLQVCTCVAERSTTKSQDCISISCPRKLPSVQKALNSSNGSVRKCKFCSFELSSSLKSFVGDLDTSSAEFSSIKMFWANMVAFCVLHSARGLLPCDFAITNLFEKHAKNGFADVVFRSSSVFDWCVSTKVPYMTSLGNSDLQISQNLEAMSWRSGLSNCNLMQELFIPTNHSRNACWLAQCWIQGGFSSVILDGHRSCGKSALAKYIAESFASDAKSVYRPLTQRSAQDLFHHPLEYFSTRRFRNVELSSHLQTINIYSVQHSQCVFFIDDVHVMPPHVLMGIRSLQQLGFFWFLDLNRHGISSALNVINIPPIIVSTKNSSFDRAAAISNFALNIDCSDFSNAGNLKCIYSVLAQVSLQSACISASDLVGLIDQIGNACLSLHLLLQGMKWKSPCSRLIARGLQGILECGDFLKSKDETVRLFCHEMIHSVLDETNIPLLDSDYASYLHPQLKSSEALTFQKIFRTVSSCFPQSDLKEMEFLKMTRIFEAHSDEISLLAASRKRHYTAQNATNAISILQDSASQLLAHDDSLRNSHQIDFLHIDSNVSDHDDSARNCYGFSEDTTNVLRFIRVLRCKGSHIVVTNANFLKSYIIPLAVFHCGLELIVLSSKPSMHYDRSDAISDLRQIFESAVFSSCECVVVLSHLHLNDNTFDVFLSAIHWVDTIGHACFDEQWMLEQSRRFVDSGVSGYSSDETIRLMRTRFISNFHVIICCNEEDTCNVIKPLTQLNSVCRLCLMHSAPTQNQVVTSAFITNWLEQFRWDHWSNGLCLRNLYNSHSSSVIRDHRDSLHPGLSRRLVSLLSSLNIGYEQVLSLFLSPSVSDLKIQAERALEYLQCSVHFLQWFFQVNSDVGVCPDYIPFSFPKDISSFCISVFDTCTSTILQSSSARAIKFSMFSLSIYVSQVIYSLEKQVMNCFNRLLQLEAAIRFSFECALIRIALASVLEAAQIQHQIATLNLFKFEDELSAESDCGNDSSLSSAGNTEHALLLVSAEQSAKQVQQLSSMKTFCECHSHISLEEMSSEAFALTSSIIRIVPDAALQQALLMVGSVIEEDKLQDLLSALIPIACTFDKKTRLNCKIDITDMPSYNFEFIQLLPFHALVKYSLSWTFDFTKLASACDIDQASSDHSERTLPCVFSLASHVSIKNVSAFIRISTIVNHLGSGPNPLPILVLDPKRIFQQAFISLFSIEDVCITSVGEGHNSLAFARAVLTAIRGGLCLIVQGFSCCPSIGFPKLLLNLINKNFSTEGSEEQFLKLDPDTKSMANVLGIPSSRDIPIHPNFCLILVCNENDCLSPHHSSTFKVIALDVSHHVLSGIVSNCILQQQKDAFDNRFSSIKSLCSNLQLLKQSWESIILDSAQASGNFSYGAFAFKAISEDSVDDGWGHVIETCLRDPNALLNQESLKTRLQHKLQQNQIAMSLKEFCIVLNQFEILHDTSGKIAHTLVYSMKACSQENNFINLLACFDTIISSARAFKGSSTKKTKTLLEKAFSQDQNAHFDDEPPKADVQDDRIDRVFTDVYWDRSLLDSVEIDVHNFIAASLSESQRLSFSLFCAWHMAKASGHVSDDEWLILTCSDEHLKKLWEFNINSMQDVSVPTSARVASKDPKVFLQAITLIKNKLHEPSIRSWLESLSSTCHAAKACKQWQTHSNFLPSDSSLHGLCLIAARVHAPHLYSFCVQEFLKIYSAHLKLEVPISSMNQNQLLVACKNAPVTIICTSLPHSCIKSSLVQLCPDCRSVPTSKRACVHFLIFDCKDFEGVEQSTDTVVDDNYSNQQSAPEVSAIPGFPFGRLHSALVCAINDAVASGKGLIVLHATSFVSYWQGYLRHSSITSNSSNSNQLSQLVLVCDSRINACSIRAVSAWSRIVFWNFPLTSELSDSYGAGILWLLRNLRQQVMDSSKFKVACLSEGFRAVKFQERLFLRITSCLMSFALAIHTRSCIQCGFFTGQQMFEVQLFFNHAVSVAISLMQFSSSCDTKNAFLSYGFPWLRHQVIFGCGLQLATTRDTTLIMSIFDSLLSPDIVSDEFNPPFLETGVFPSLHTANDIDSLVASIAESKNHAVDSLRSISLLKLPEWYSLQYSWIQGLLCNCFMQNCEPHGVCVSPQLLLSKTEVMQLLQHVDRALPSAEVLSSILNTTHQHENGGTSHQLLLAAVVESTILIAALKQTRALVHELLENLSRCCTLCIEEEADFHALRHDNAPERWCNFFGFPKVLRVSEFIASATQFASFWSSWPEHKSTGVIHANCFKNFGRVLQLLALSKANNSGCKLTDVKCVVLHMADKAIGVEFCIQVQGLIGRGFGWNGRVAVPVSDMQTNFEESSATKLQRQSAPFEMLKCNQLVPLGEVSIVAMSPRELQDCSSYCTATLHSMPILRDGFDSHEVDSAPLISFFFDNQTSNFMCVLH